MQPIHYIFTRWSVHDPTRFSSFNIGLHSKDKEDYTQKLFNTSRLNARFEFFEKMTYPSIKNQTCANYEWYIYASTILPNEYKLKLDKFECSNIKIVYVEDYPSVSHHIRKLLSGKTNFTTMKLDDDDGLAPTFLEKLNFYASETGKVVTFPIGMQYTISDNKLVFGGKCEYRNINLGITAIGFDIFSTGNHCSIDQRYKVIADNTPDMYWVCCSEVCDTKRKFSTSSVSYPLIR